MESRYYVLQLTNDERDYTVQALRSALHADGKPRDLADRIEREAGEDSLLDLATGRLRAWYYSRVRDMAEGILSDMLDGTETRDLSEVLHETIDGTDLVIYTYKAKAVLLASDNEDAYEDQMGEPAPSVEAAAFMAIEADVTELLQAWADGHAPEGVAIPEGFDLYDSETWTLGTEKDSEAFVEIPEDRYGRDFSSPEIARKVQALLGDAKSAQPKPEGTVPS